VVLVWAESEEARKINRNVRVEVFFISGGFAGRINGFAAKNVPKSGKTTQSLFQHIHHIDRPLIKFG
jgi:hypothetical protein